MEREAMMESGAGDGGGDGTELRMDMEYVRSYAVAATANLMVVPGAGGVLLAHSPLLSALLRRGVAVITLNHHLEIEGAAVAGTRLCGALRLHRM